MPRTYDPETAAQVRQIADQAMSSTQDKLEQLSSLSSGSRTGSFERLIGWQTSIGNISFSLAAIGGTVLIGKDFTQPYVLISLFIMLAIGLWITLFHKRLIEHGATHDSQEVDEFRPLMDTKKKAAFELFEDPASIEKHITFMQSELNIMQLTKKNELKEVKLFKNERTDYRNDIWLAMLVTAVYFLFWPIGQKVYTTYATGNYSLIFWLVWTLLMLVILRSALNSKPDIQKVSKGKLANAKARLKDTKEYIRTIEERIESLSALVA